MKMVELQRAVYTLNSPSPCEVSLNTVALFDLGLVSSSRFRSTGCLPPAFPPLLPEHQEIAQLPKGQILQLHPVSGLKPAWTSHSSKCTHLAVRAGSLFFSVLTHPSGSLYYSIFFVHVCILLVFHVVRAIVKHVCL